MPDTYFARARAVTGSRFWINNPTAGEIGLALENGAMGCTTNPAFGGNLVKRSPDEVLPIVRASLEQGQDDESVAEWVQAHLVSRIAEQFLPLYEQTAGREGFVSLQGAPEADTDADRIAREARDARRIAPNVVPKIPATAPGLVAMEAIIAEGSPVIVTEVFSLAQVVETCERWLAVAQRAQLTPPFFMSPITGIFGDHLRKVAARDRIEIDAHALEMAGVLLARRCFALVREREYPVTLLYGGARTRLDFTGLIGGSMAATINWSTAAELLAADPAVASTICDPVDPLVERALTDAFPEVHQALDVDGLAVEDFEAFGPVQHFRDNFIAGWETVLNMIAAERSAVGAAGA